MDALVDALEAGLTRAVGVSNYSAAQMRRAHTALSRRGVALACNQVEYNLLQRSVERNGLLSLCRELGVTLVAYRPIASGLLSGKYTPDNPPQDWRGLVYRRGTLAQIQPVVDRLRQIGEAHGGKTPSQVALNWLICKGALPIPGAKNVRQAQENAGALGWRLTDDEVAALDAAAP
jgi:aryl-alcohol dehydrogenase-like predicted oxidoreductase